jgi:internalin A
MRRRNLRMQTTIPGASRRSRAAVLTVLCLLLGSGCAEKAEEAKTESGSPPAVEAPIAEPAGRAAFHWTPERVDRALLETNPGYQGEALYQIQDGRVVALQLSGTTITDLSALKEMGVQALDLRGLPIADLEHLRGLDLSELYLEETDVRDLRPLEGMRLKQIYLSNTHVGDLTPLKGMPLEQLNLLGTDVQDLTPLVGMPLVFLWLNETPVSDISPLADCSRLMSLTLHRTRVSDLRPLSELDLKRLHIGETPVTDLTPLKGLDLNRLIFTPSSIQKGLETVREMESLQELGTTFENRMPPEVFWHLYDTGSLP